MVARSHRTPIAQAPTAQLGLTRSSTRDESATRLTRHQYPSRYIVRSSRYIAHDTTTTVAPSVPSPHRATRTMQHTLSQRSFSSPRSPCGRASSYLTRAFLRENWARPLTLSLVCTRVIAMGRYYINGGHTCTAAPRCPWRDTTYARDAPLPPIGVRSGRAGGNANRTSADSTARSDTVQHA